MSAPRSTRRVRRTAAVVAVLGVAGVIAAPAALAADTAGSGYASVAPTDTSVTVLGTKYGPGSGSSHHGGSSGGSSGTSVLGSKYSSSLAFTGFEAGAVGLVGAALVAGGTVLVVTGRRRSRTVAS